MRISQVWKALHSSPIGLLGLLLLLAQVLVSLYVVSTFPEEFGARFWSNPVHWVDNPKAAPPEWVPGLRGRPFVRHWSTTLLEPSSSEERGNTILSNYPISYELTTIAIPEFLSLTVSHVQFVEKAPLLGLTLIRPDETRISMLRHAIKAPRDDEESPFSRHVDDPLRIQINAEESVISSIQEFLDEEHDLQLDEAEIKSQVLEILFGKPSEVDGKFEPLLGEYEFLFQTATRAPEDRIRSVQLVIGGDSYGALGTDSIWERPGTRTALRAAGSSTHWHYCVLDINSSGHGIRYYQRLPGRNRGHCNSAIFRHSGQHSVVAFADIFAFHHWAKFDRNYDDPSGLQLARPSHSSAIHGFAHALKPID